jgi:hypothetical protein
MPFKNPEGHAYIEIAVKSLAPPASGAYGIYSAYGCRIEWIYIGEAQDIRERLLEHLGMKGPEDKCIAAHQPTGFTYEMVEAVRRVGRQDELILELRPACNQKLG